jgi:hypothetical protein
MTARTSAPGKSADNRGRIRQPGVYKRSPAFLPTFLAVQLLRLAGVGAVPFVAKNPSQPPQPDRSTCRSQCEWEEWHFSRARRGPRGPLRPLSLALFLTGSAFTAQSAPTAKPPSAGKLASALIVTARWESSRPIGNAERGDRLSARSRPLAPCSLETCPKAPILPTLATSQ